ncbi:HNH endonuclease [Mycobacterium phage Phabba]|uniref:Uncharacterized protein n=1 Tax=Mycobacterium phage Phabba TaxID=2027899 RepID=A0A249XS78_9CAUD|nr:HNH endonuclease [Mycobacterium phage Phabba]ASZ74589.1 hypothetical protein SEA_PHABBA_14 [Mycobacterium phage Phabba]
MDPDETLRLLRKYASDTPGEFSETFEALDEWIGGGGFLPQNWRARDCNLCPHEPNFDHRGA